MDPETRERERGKVRGREGVMGVADSDPCHCRGNLKSIPALKLRFCGGEKRLLFLNVVESEFALCFLTPLVEDEEGEMETVD